MSANYSNSSFDSNKPSSKSPQDKILTRQSFSDSLKPPVPKKPINLQSPAKAHLGFLNKAYEPCNEEKQEWDTRIKKKTPQGGNGTPGRKPSLLQAARSADPGSISANKRREEGIELEIIELKPKRQLKLEESLSDKGL